MSTVGLPTRIVRAGRGWPFHYAQRDTRGGKKGRVGISFGYQGACLAWLTVRRCSARPLPPLRPVARDAPARLARFRSASAVVDRSAISAETHGTRG